MLKKISLITFFLGLSVQTAFAQGGTAGTRGRGSGVGSNPIPYANRGLTLEPGTVRLDLSNAGFGITDSPGIPALGGGRRGLLLDHVRGTGRDTAIGLGIGASVGIIDNLEAGILFAPLRLSPDSGFGNMGAYTRYRFVTGNFELAAQVAAVIPTEDGFGMSFGLPALFRLSDTMRLDTGVVVNAVFDPAEAVGLGVPFLLAFQLSDTFWGGLRSGINVLDFDAAEDTISIPLGVAVGYTIVMSGAAPMLDLTADYTWTQFANTFGPDLDVELEVFSVTVGAALYLDLF